MMRVVKYDIQDNILQVGFKANDFVVYTQIAYNKNKTKEELLQLAYVQAKPSIEYEKTLDKHSFTTNEEGDEFIPEESKPIKLEADFRELKGKVLDQYGDTYSLDIKFSIEGTDKARIEDNIVIEDEVGEDEEYFVIAQYENLEERYKKIIYASKPSELELLQQQILDIDNKASSKHEVLQMMNYLKCKIISLINNIKFY